MYKSFKEARNAAIKAINNIYGGDKMGCVVTERKTRQKMRFGFRFNEEDTHGEYVNINGDFYRMTTI